MVSDFVNNYKKIKLYGCVPAKDLHLHSHADYLIISLYIVLLLYAYVKYIKLFYKQNIIILYIFIN